MKGDSYEFEAVLWEWEARRDSWVFASLPPDISDEIAAQPRPPSGFNSVKVRVRIGATQSSTSIFPNADAYVVPIKKAVRDKHGIGIGDTVTIGIDLID